MKSWLLRAVIQRKRFSFDVKLLKIWMPLQTGSSLLLKRVFSMLYEHIYRAKQKRHRPQVWLWRTREVLILQEPEVLVLFFEILKVSLWFIASLWNGCSDTQHTGFWKPLSSFENMMRSGICLYPPGDMTMENNLHRAAFASLSLGRFMVYRSGCIYGLPIVLTSSLSLLLYHVLWVKWDVILTNISIRWL